MCWAKRALLSVAALGLLACDSAATPTSEGKLSREGESCTRSADCQGELGCRYQVCVDRSRPDGSAAATSAAYAAPADRDRVPQLR
jgi:hypothetical protein